MAAFERPPRLPGPHRQAQPLPAAKQLVHLKQDKTDESKQEGYEHGYFDEEGLCPTQEAVDTHDVPFRMEAHPCVRIWDTSSSLAALGKPRTLSGNFSKSTSSR